MRKRTITQAYFYDVAPRTVFRALTEARQLKRWFLDSAKISPVEGGSYTFTWKGYPSQKGEVKKVVADRLLALSWPNRVKGKVLLTEVHFTLRKKGGGTLLTVRHAGFQEGDDWVWLYGAVQSGWAYFLTNLKSVLSQGLDLRSEHDRP